MCIYGHGVLMKVHTKCCIHWEFVFLGHKQVHYADMDSHFLLHRNLCHHQEGQMDTDNQTHTPTSPEKMDIVNLWGHTKQIHTSMCSLLLHLESKHWIKLLEKTAAYTIIGFQIQTCPSTLQPKLSYAGGGAVEVYFWRTTCCKIRRQFWRQLAVTVKFSPSSKQ